MQILQNTKMYDMSSFIDQRCVLFPSPEEEGNLIHGIIWEQDVLYKDQVKLLATNYKTGEITEIFNVCGKYEFPSDVYYNKIELLYLEGSSIEPSEPEDETIYMIKSEQFGQVALQDEEQQVIYCNPEDVDLVVIDSVVKGTIKSEVPPKYYRVIGTIGEFTDSLDLQMGLEGTTSTLRNESVTLYGMITYQTIAADEKTEENTSPTAWEYFLNNTELRLFTIPAREAYSDYVDPKYVYEYIEFFYTVDKIDSELISELVSSNEEVQRQDTGLGDNQLRIGGTILTAQSEWNSSIPGKAIPYNAIIEKGKNVRVDVYLRYWTGEPGVRV